LKRLERKGRKEKRGGKKRGKGEGGSPGPVRCFPSHVYVSPSCTRKENRLGEEKKEARCGASLFSFAKKGKKGKTIKGKEGWCSRPSPPSPDDSPSPSRKRREKGIPREKTMKSPTEMSTPRRCDGERNLFSGGGEPGLIFYRRSRKGKRKKKSGIGGGRAAHFPLSFRYPLSSARPRGGKGGRETRTHPKRDRTAGLSLPPQSAVLIGP